MLKLTSSHFAQRGHEQAPGYYPDADRALLANIKKAWPELNDWGDLPLGVAWWSYSQDVWFVSWLEESQHSLDRAGLIPFIAYIHLHDTVESIPDWGVAIEDLVSHAKENGIAV